MSAVLLRRHPIVAVLLTAVLLFLSLALTWHLVAMDHRDAMGLLGGCLCVLAASLLLAFPPRRPFGSRPELEGTSTAGHPIHPLPVSRPPPMEGPLQGTVLLH